MSTFEVLLLLVSLLTVAVNAFVCGWLARGRAEADRREVERQDRENGPSLDIGDEAMRDTPRARASRSGHNEFDRQRQDKERGRA